MKLRILARILALGDSAWIFGAILLAGVFRYGTISSLERHFPDGLAPLCLSSAAIWGLLSLWMRLDCFEGGWRFSAAASRLLLGVSCMLSLLLAGGYLFREYVSRLMLGYFGVLLFVGFLALRYVVRSFLRSRYRAGKVRRTIIVGNDRIGRELALKMERHPELMCQIVGFLHPDEDRSGVVCDTRGQSTSAQLNTFSVLSLLEKERVSELIVAMAVHARPEILNLAALCRERGISVSVVPQPYELYLSKPNLTNLDGVPLLQLQDVPTSAAERTSKRVFDVLASCILFLPALIIVLPSAFYLRCRKARAFRWEKRSGENGTPFYLLRLNVDRNVDGRESFVENVLTDLSITELPQLWNVLRGEMSLVGPRPEGYERVRHYTEWQQQRLCVKPGITGLAQVHGLRDQHSSEEKTRFDLQYQLNPSLINDISLLLQTVCTLFIRLLRLHGSAAGTVPAESMNSSQPSVDSFQEVIPIAYRSQSSAD